MHVENPCSGSRITQDLKSNNPLKSVMASGSVPPRFFFKERFEAISNYEGNNVGILAMSAMGKGWGWATISYLYAIQISVYFRFLIVCP